MIGSKEVNRIIKSIIHPTLKENEYSAIQSRKAWRHFDNKVYHFLISSVGSYFSNVTGFPPMSISSSINIFYLNFPDGKVAEKYDKKDRPLPKQTECHFRFPLEKNDYQVEYTKTIQNSIERKRRDVWWIEPNGNNIVEVILDLQKTLLEYAFPLVEKPSYSFEEQLRRYRDR